LGCRADDRAAPEDVVFEEWTVPWENSRPRDPYVDAQGRVWFVGQAGNYIAYLEPGTGEFRRYEIEEGTHPHNLIIDEAGRSGTRAIATAGSGASIRRPARRRST
jgi:virginiamycin B lyase